MRKTFIALLALAGVASADMLDLLASNDGWTFGTGRAGRGNWSVTEVGLALNNCNWGQSHATYDFEKSFTGCWDMNATVDRYDNNAVFALTLVGSTQAITIGSKDYGSGTAYYGTTDVLDARAYALSGAWDNGGTLVTGTSLVEGAFNVNQTATLSASTVLDADANVILTLTVGGTAVENAGVATINLGKDFALERIVISGDGRNSTANWNVTSLTVVPEPATATLSLLALVGLAARRRRK